MDLNAIYAVSNAINKLAEKGEIRYEDIDNAIVISIEVTPDMHYGIDKELYRITHENSTDGFIHSHSPIEACINDVHFLIKEKGYKTESLEI